MKTSTMLSLKKGIFLGIMSVILMVPGTASAKKIPFLRSTVTPAASGYVKVKKDKNKNYFIRVDVSDLAEVGRLQPSMQTYVVWMVTDREIVKNIGRLKSSKKFLSRKLTGYVETISSFQPTKIFITAELDESVQVPGEQVVLTTDRFWE